jgi:hypothetical protein
VDGPGEVLDRNRSGECGGLALERVVVGTGA